MQTLFHNNTDNMSSYAYVSLSLIGLCALAGAGVGVGSGVAMMYSQMAQAEQEQKTSGAVAHSPGTLVAYRTHPCLNSPALDVCIDLLILLLLCS